MLFFIILNINFMEGPKFFQTDTEKPLRNPSPNSALYCQVSKNHDKIAAIKVQYGGLAFSNRFV